MQKLQALQNKSLRMLSGLDYLTPTETLLKHCNVLSVHQLVSYHISCQVYKIKSTKLPNYHYNRLFLNNNNNNNNENRVAIHPRAARSNTPRVEYKLSLGRSNFFYQASKIWSLIDDQTRNAQTIEAFKNYCRKWTLDHVPIKP